MRRNHNHNNNNTDNSNSNNNNNNNNNKDNDDDNDDNDDHDDNDDDNNNIINCIERRKSRFLQSPHSAVNCLQRARPSGQGRIECQSGATHRVLITCNMSFSTWHEVTAHLSCVTQLKSHLF